MNFTNSHYEPEMKKKPQPEEPPRADAPDGSRCVGCPYWRGVRCMTCFRALLRRGR